ncbi:MAG: hypothetical protein SFX74_00150 [Fimbriimonadaceae bacterium]|nr:hypothetical protein [Fimbriimonadaceae bacterium]
MILLLNGPPRTGKSSIIRGLRVRAPGWIALGVDHLQPTLPPELHPGLGLRPPPGDIAERPEVEAALPRLWRAALRSIAAHADEGFSVVADLSLHTRYPGGFDPWAILRREWRDRPHRLVAVSAAPEEVVRRRESTGFPSELDTVLRWQRACDAVPGVEFRLDTTGLSSAQLADRLISELFPPGG